MMAKDLTVKDVQYALQFGHETLVHYPRAATGKQPVWELEPSRNRVKPSVANEIAASGSVHAIETKLSGFQRLAWRAAA